MMGVLFFSTFIGNVLSGTLAAPWETMSKDALGSWLNAYYGLVRTLHSARAGHGTRNVTNAC